MQQSVTRVPAVDGRRRTKLAQAQRPQVQASYMRGLPEGGMYLRGPVPTLRDSAEDVRIAWPRAAARAIDALHNNGWIAGAVEKSCALMIGEGLKPNLKPDFTWADWTVQQEAEWARLAERRFQAWVQNPHECDAGGRYTLAQIQQAALRQWFGTGEAIAQFPTIARTGGAWSTKVRLVPSHWLSQKTLASERIEHGVILDRHSAPAGYVFDMRDRATGLLRRFSRNRKTAFRGSFSVVS